MGKTSKKSRSGLTLIEIMVAITVIIVGVLGAMMYRYHSALDARKADVKIGAARVGLLLLEDWKGTHGNTLPPTRDETGLKVTGSGGNYTVTLEGGTGATYYAVLPATPTLVTLNGVEMKELRVEVFWSRSGTPSAEDNDGSVTLKDWTD